VSAAGSGRFLEFLGRCAYIVGGTVTEQPGSKKSHELFFALVGPVGTDSAAIRDILAKELSALDYETVSVRMSRLLEELPALDSAFPALPDSPEDLRIKSRMDAGDAFRKKVKSGAALAYLAIVYLRRVRRELADRPKRAYIFDSLKRPEELTALRRIYGDALVCISMFAPRDVRLGNLAQRIGRTKSCSSEECQRGAEDLVKEDQRGGDKDFGQNVAETFAMADAFVRQDTQDAMQAQVARLVELVFGHPFRTPSRDEIGMFHARAAALRSADLSRQVGAVLATPDGSILAAGCNEVPRGGGGTYWEGDDPDDRDFKRGRDPNVEEKLVALAEMFKNLSKSGWLATGIAQKTCEELASLATRKNGVLDGTRVDSLIEFGRVVHAEMNALMDAALRGVAVKGSTLYCTTFPCHNCARHILAAGVRRVVYIEPYPKSLAVKLYRPTIKVDERSDCSMSELVFESFVGVAPRRFIPLFELANTKRKDPNGFVRPWQRTTASPRFEQLFADHESREQLFVIELEEALRKVGVKVSLESNGAHIREDRPSGSPKEPA
jgi:deoxycytidylate deaminase